MYLLKVNLLIPSGEDVAMESEIVEKVQKILPCDVELVSTISEELDGLNFGKCSKCGCWVSDRTQPNWVVPLSNGAKIGIQWYCDICLPEDHPNAF